MKLNFNRIFPNGMKVASNLIVAPVSVFFLSFPLLLWKMNLSTNWAILFLASTSLLLYLAVRDILIPIFEARVQVELQPKYAKSAFLLYD